MIVEALASSIQIPNVKVFTVNVVGTGDENKLHDVSLDERKIHRDPAGNLIWDL